MIPEPGEVQLLRKQAGMTQKQLAVACGLSQAMISRIENGTINPTVNTMITIAKALLNTTGQSKVLNARDLMNAPPIYCKPSNKIKEVSRIMEKNNISQLPVISQGRCVGTITETLLLKHLSKSTKKASDIMERPLPTLDTDADTTKIQRLLAQHPAVLVTNKNSIIGIVTKADLIRAML